jgi:hypothetical protein
VEKFHFSHDDMLKMPMRRFWFYLKQVDRINAEEDLRLLRLLAAAHSGETIEQVTKDLNQVMGRIYVYEPKAKSFEVEDENAMDPNFDRAGLHALKGKSRVK